MKKVKAGDIIKHNNLSWQVKPLDKLTQEGHIVQEYMIHKINFNAKQMQFLIHWINTINCIDSFSKLPKQLDLKKIARLNSFEVLTKLITGRIVDKDYKEYEV